MADKKKATKVAETTKTGGVMPPLKDLNKPQSAGFIFTACVLLLLTVSLAFALVLNACGVKIGEEKPDWYLYLSFSLSQAVFLAVALVAFFKMKVSVREVAGKPSIKYFAIALAMQFGLLSLSELNGWFVGMLKGLGYTPNPVVIPSTQGFGVVGVLFVVALLPAVFEELVFRGFILRGLKGLGGVASVLLCGALFALYHQNPVQTLYQFCCGLCFALIAFRSGSIFPGVLAHFANNAFVVLYYHFTGLDTLPLPWWMIVVTALCLAATLAYLIFFDKKEKETPLREEKKDFKGLFSYASIGLIVCAVNWISALFVA